MTARSLSALGCALAAVALLVAAFMPWFVTEHAGDPDSVILDRDRSDDRPYLPDADRPDPGQVRGNYGLVSGETCIRFTCKPARYTGAPGLADDAFAWLGRATLGAALAGLTLLLAVALAARRRRRPIVRGWAATVAATAAGLGAAFASTQTLAGMAGFVERGAGLTAVVVGAALAGLGTAWPWGPRGESSAARRLILALALAGLATLAWITLVQHAWWRSGRSLDVLRVSPLGVEVCDGDTCRLSTALGVHTLLRALACTTSLFTAALFVPAFGAAVRVARGIAPGAWAWTTAIVACLALGAGLATWATYPSNDVMGIGWGLPVFAVALGGVGAAAVVAAILIRTHDVDDAAPLATAAAATGHGATHAVAPGARPVLPALGATPALAVPAAPAMPVSSPYAPKPAPLDEPAPPRPLPQAQARPRPPQSTPTPTPGGGALARRSSPACPTCRLATLWHGKRGAWWCSTCKQTV